MTSPDHADVLDPQRVAQFGGSRHATSQAHRHPAGQPDPRFGTCARVSVQALQASTTPPGPRFDRISGPQLAADRLVAAWLDGDRAAADKLTISRSVTERLFSEPAPARRPALLPCRLVDHGL